MAKNKIDVAEALKDITRSKKIGKVQMKREAKAREVKKGIVILDYDIDNRRQFIDKIHSMRIGNRKTDPMSYKAIAKAMTLLGFRNRVSKDITPQFVGNVLHRHPIKEK